MAQASPKRRIGAVAWILAIAGLLLTLASILELPPYMETKAEESDRVIAWWLGNGEFGRMRTVVLPAERLVAAPEELQFEYQNSPQSVALPVVLREFSLLGFEVLERQSLSSDSNRLYQTLWVHVPLWIPGVLLLAYPLARFARCRQHRPKTTAAKTDSDD